MSFWHRFFINKRKSTVSTISNNYMAEFLERISHHLLPCVYKKFFGIDCPFCGFQRSILALLQGDVGQCIALYPPLFPLILSCVILFAFRRSVKFKRIAYIILVADSTMLVGFCIFRNIFLC